MKTRNLKIQDGENIDVLRRPGIIHTVKEYASRRNIKFQFRPRDFTTFLTLDNCKGSLLGEFHSGFLFCIFLRRDRFYPLI